VRSAQAHRPPFCQPELPAGAEDRSRAVARLNGAWRPLLSLWPAAALTGLHGSPTIKVMMRALAKMASVAQIHVTAAVMLVAGVPHLHCRCADGTTRLLVAGHALGSSTCCCDRSRVPAQAGATEREAKGASCCGKQPRRHAQASPDAPCGLHAQGCTKTLARAEMVTVPHSQTVISKDLTPVGDWTPATPARPSVATAANRQTSPGGQCHAPPGDLVTLLQHLLI